jgi:hypothetical protein
MLIIRRAELNRELKAMESLGTEEWTRTYVRCGAAPTQSVLRARTHQTVRQQALADDKNWRGGKVKL